MKKDNRKNYLDNIPKHNKKWQLNDKKMVEITVENKGFFNTLAQKIYKKPRYSFIELDTFGSFVWQQIDGKKNIYEIGQILKKEHKKAEDKLYERLSAFFGILEQNKYIVFADESKEQ